MKRKFKWTIRNWPDLKLVLILTGLIFFVWPGYSQVTIGKDSPAHSGAALELVSNETRGLLLPRLSLTSATVWEPVTGNNPTEGMMVYNTNNTSANGLNGLGAYVWSNGRWNILQGTDCAECPKPGQITEIIFDPNPVSIDQGKTFTARVEAVSNAGYYDWELPTGLSGSSSSNTITITGDISGNYDASRIKVRAYNDCGYSNEVAGKGTIEIKPVDPCTPCPKPGQIDKIIFDPDPVIIDQGQTFTARVNPVANAEYYAWELPTGLSGASSTNTITITGSTGGYYDANEIKVRAYNNCGYSNEVLGEGVIEVKPEEPCIECPKPGSIGPIVFSSRSIEQGQTFTASVTPAANAAADFYLWVLPSGLSGSSNTHTITITGNDIKIYNAYDIKVYAINDCGYSLAEGTDNIEVKPSSVCPVPDRPGAITITPSNITAGNSVMASIVPVLDATHYIWTLPAGMSAPSTTTTNPYIVISTDESMDTGLYTVKVQAKNDCGISEFNDGGGVVSISKVTVCIVPAQPGPLVFKPQPVEQYGTLTVTMIGIPIHAEYFEWTYPTDLLSAPSNITTDAQITFTVLTGTSFNANLIKVKAKNYCAESQIREGEGTIVVTCKKPAQPKSITFSKNPIFVGNTTIATATSVAGAAYEWVLPSGLTGSSTGSSIEIKATKAGSYTIKVRTKNECGVSEYTSSCLTVKGVGSYCPSDGFVISKGAYTPTSNDIIPSSCCCISTLNYYKKSGKDLCMYKEDMSATTGTDWNTAADYCKNLEADTYGQNTWRLPNIREIHEILAQKNPTKYKFNSHPVSGSQVGYRYWSSTRSAKYGNDRRYYGWLLYSPSTGYRMGEPQIVPLNQSNVHVRCVKTME